MQGPRRGRGGARERNTGEREAPISVNKGLLGPLLNRDPRTLTTLSSFRRGRSLKSSLSPAASRAVVGLRVQVRLR